MPAQLSSRSKALAKAGRWPFTLAWLGIVVSILGDSQDWLSPGLKTAFNLIFGILVLYCVFVATAFLFSAYKDHRARARKPSDDA